MPVTARGGLVPLTFLIVPHQPPTGPTQLARCRPAVVVPGDGFAGFFPVPHARAWPRLGRPVGVAARWWPGGRATSPRCPSHGRRGTPSVCAGCSGALACWDD